MGGLALVLFGFIARKIAYAFAGRMTIGDVLKEKLKVDKERLDLAKVNDLTTQQPAITGGYIFASGARQVKLCHVVADYTPPSIMSGLSFIPYSKATIPGMLFLRSAKALFIFSI